LGKIVPFSESVETVRRWVGPDKRWVLPQLVLVGIALAAAPLESRARRKHRPRNAAPPLLGALLLIGATALMGRAKRDLAECFTMSPTPVHDGRLVSTGVYVRIRHPMYAGVLLVLAAYGLLWRAWSGLLALVGAAAFLTVKTAREERDLKRVYPAYADYCERVPWRFLPGIV
jgi:protein-S-isoprenylcysteine O-methyltransferase Ste14